MQIELQSPCKVNLILNILGRRPDGFHELETVMQPIPVYDTLAFETGRTGIHLTCSNAELPVDSGNLVYRAAEAFFAAATISPSASIHLEKRIPLAAGLGGGSGKAGTTLLGLNELFDRPLSLDDLNVIAARLGSDIPFFLQSKPAFASGRGEQVQSLDNFAALHGCWIMLIHPGFGVSTPWAYKNLARFPKALNGEAGRARRLINLLEKGSLKESAPEFFNSLEAPVLEKYPLLAIFQEFLRKESAVVALMSGSGSTTFAIFESEAECAAATGKFRAHFGDFCWMAAVPL